MVCLVHICTCLKQEPKHLYLNWQVHGLIYKNTCPIASMNGMVTSIHHTNQPNKNKLNKCIYIYHTWILCWTQMTHLFLRRFDPDHPYCFCGEFINKSRDSSISLASASAFFAPTPRLWKHGKESTNPTDHCRMDTWWDDGEPENKNMYGNGELVGGWTNPFEKY